MRYPWFIGTYSVYIETAQYLSSSRVKCLHFFAFFVEIHVSICMITSLNVLPGCYFCVHYPPEKKYLLIILVNLLL